MRRRWLGLLRMLGSKHAALECAVLDFQLARKLLGKPMTYEEAKAKVIRLVS